MLAAYTLAQWLCMCFSSSEAAPPWVDELLSADGWCSCGSSGCNARVSRRSAAAVIGTCMRYHLSPCCSTSGTAPADVSLKSSRAPAAAASNVSMYRYSFETCQIPQLLCASVLLDTASDTEVCRWVSTRNLQNSLPVPAWPPEAAFEFQPFCTTCCS